jgi:flavin reductase (DIM6/NTAB) family NADH-FMN oxidoreductase RutF
MTPARGGGAMKAYDKRDFPVSDIRRFLEPGPVVLVSSSWRGKTDVMAMGLHTVMEFAPSLVGCIISSANHSFETIRRSKQCTVNIPEAHLGAKVAGIGNTSGRDTDKLARFGLTTTPADKVAAPLIAECYASFECRLADAALVRKYNFFVFEVVKAHVAVSPKYPRTLHYRGDGVFMISGENTAKYRRLFRPGML